LWAGNRVYLLIVYWRSYDALPAVRHSGGIDKEYDAEKSVPDFQPYAEFYINETEKARDELECLDVPFGPTSRRGEVYRPGPQRKSK
jgi:hypothetical protein